MTKQERNTVYKAMLNEFELGVVHYGFCWLLSILWTRRRSEGGLFMSYDIEDYPELIKFKPLGSLVDDYWFPLSMGIEHRKNILKACIAETND